MTADALERQQDNIQNYFEGDDHCSLLIPPERFSPGLLFANVFVTTGNTIQYLQRIQLAQILNDGTSRVWRNTKR